MERKKSALRRCRILGFIRGSTGGRFVFDIHSIVKASGSPKSQPIFILESAEDKSFVGDSIRDNFVATRAAPVLDHMQGPAKSARLASSAHQDDRVGVGKNVTLRNRLVDQFFEKFMRGRKIG